MARYTGAVCRLCRREGQKLFLKGDRCYTDKCSLERRGYAPGMHGNARNKKLSEYGLQLREKHDVTKVDGKDADTKLKDAEFKLYDENGKYVIVDADGKVTGWADNEAGGSTLKSDENGLFKVIGLDDGTYWLKETKAPDGYNLITDPIKIEIKATTVNDQDWTAMEGPSDALTALEIKVTVGSTTTSGNGDTESGIVETDIKNNKGAELPETGGMGTTIFYVLGAILVLGAGGLLIARRRTDSEK